jgi:hypothetical protein
VDLWFLRHKAIVPWVDYFVKDFGQQSSALPSNSLR